MRYDLDPLLKATGLTIALAAEHLGWDRTRMYYWKRKGLSFEKADDLAVKFGLLPEEVWGEWADEANERAAVLEAAERAAAERRLESSRAAGRRYRAKKRLDPDYRAKQVEYLREYRDRYREGLNAERRARYRRNAKKEIAAVTARRRQRKAEQRAKAS